MNNHPAQREDSLDGCGRPCVPLSCLLFSAVWLRCNQSLLVQETPSAKDLDLTCSTTFPFSDASRSFQILASSSGSQRRTTTPCFSSFCTLPLETGCSSITTADITTYNRVGWMWPLPFRRLAMYYLEHPRPGWICFLQTKEQRIQTQISQKTLGQQCWLRDLGGRIGYLHSQGHST